MRLRARMYAGVGRQLRHPRGLAGHLVGAMMDRRNRRAIAAAVDALSPPPGAVVADIGFGGGLGLGLLLDRVGIGGRVHGIEVSTTMLSRAARRFRIQIADSRLTLHAGSLTELPLPDASLDGAITVNTIYFVDDLERAFSELGRALKASGRMVVGVADPDWMRAQPVVRHGFRIRPLSTVVDAAGDAGLILDDDQFVGRGPYPYRLVVLRPRA